MGALTISNKILDKYFGFLKMFDTKSKKRMITKLEESITSKSNDKLDLGYMFGAWEDTKDSAKIIKEIRDSRVEKSISKNF